MPFRASVRRAVKWCAALAALLLLAAVADAREGSRFREPVKSSGGIVATESLEAAKVGKAVLDRGGNAIDAAAATVFAIGVARPQSCGIGGGGFMVYRGANGETAALDFRETAPAAYTPQTLQAPGLHQGFTGHLTVGVPGTVSGMAAALQRFGTISLAEAVAPATKLARDGFAIPQSLSAAIAQAAPRLRLYPAAAQQFLVNGAAPPPPGYVLVQPDLAKSYDLIAQQGPAAFYTGRIAQLIADDMAASGKPPGDSALMTKADLAKYVAKWRAPLRGTYRGAEVVVMPPPTSGGVAAIEMLNLLEGFDLRKAGQSSADALHLIAEAEKIAFADRGQFLGDPDFVKVPVDGLTSKAYANDRRKEIDPARAGSPGAGKPPGAEAAAFRRAPGGEGNPFGSTTHLSVIDGAGNAVSLTCTIEQSFGSAVVAPGTGILLNNELTDFSGPGTANEPRGGKRPRSSISPTIVVRNGKPTLAIGGAGGPTIIMGSLLGVVNHVDFGLDPARAVDAERLDEQTSQQMSLENGRVDPAVQAELERRGHRIVAKGEYDSLPRVQAAGIDPRSGERLGVSDPRTDDATLASGGRPGAPAPPETAGAPPPAGARGAPACVDRRKPAVRLTRIRGSRRTTVLSGRASDRGCSGLGSVFVSVARRARGGRCRLVSFTGRLGRARSCRRTAFLLARQSSRWRLLVGRRLPRGRYLVRLRAYDGAGNATTRRLSVRVR